MSLIERSGSRFPFAPLQGFAESGRSAIVDGPYGSDLTTVDYREEGIPLVQLNNIVPGKHIPRDLKFIETSKAARLARHTALPGDIVIAKMADPVARAAQISPAFPEYRVAADCVRVRPDCAKCDPRFVVYATNSTSVFAQADALCAGTTRQRISLGEIRKLRLPGPERPTQEAIADYLDEKTGAIDALIEKKRKLLGLLAEERAALINQAVTKGLDPTVPMKDSGIPWIGEVPAHWEVRRLKTLLTFTTSGSRGWADYYSDDDDAPIFLQSGNLGKHLDLDLATTQRVNPPRGSEGERTLIETGDVPEVSPGNPLLGQ